MQTFPPVLLNPGDDVDIDFGDVFGGPPKRRSMVKEVTRHSFNETALRPRDVIVDEGLLIPRDERDEKPIFGEETSLRRRFTTDDFFDDIFRINDKEPSLSGSRILSPAQPIPLKAESPGTSFPAQFSLPAKLIKTTEIPTFGSVTRGLSKNKGAALSSPLSRSSSKADMASAAKSDSDSYVDASHVVTGKSRQFHFSIYKWPNKGVPVIIWGSSRLSSMSKAEEITPSELLSTSVDKSGKDEVGERESSLSGLKEETKRPDVQTEVDKTEIGSMSEKAFYVDVSKPREANVKPLQNDRQGEENIVSEREVRKGKTKAKNTQSSVGDSRSKKKQQGAEFHGKSSRWRAKDHDDANAKETVNIHDQLKKPTQDIPTMKPSQGIQKKDSDKERMNYNKASGVAFEQEERQEPSTGHNTSEDIDEPFHVEEITQDDNKQEETNTDTEEIKNIDAQICKWSNGKSGNIRSLLSTLQYILWSGSGWKAVPLMDMIEGNAVRKSYQRALLILHPDKLQQKGASANQKYIAEKVFELLQEAWDHFNTLGPV